MVRERDTWKLVDLATQSASKILLYGPPGTGKTTAGANTALPGTELVKITLHEEMPAASLEGHFIPDGDKFKWHNGLAIKAWLSGGRLLLDEIDRASGDVLTILYAILDDPAVAQLTLPTGRTVKPADGFSCVATMNGVPDDLPEALRDRFEVAIEVPTPHPDAIAGLSGPVQAAAAASISGDTTVRTSIRSWKSFENLRTKVGDDFAAQMVFGQRAEEIIDGLKVAALQ